MRICDLINGDFSFNFPVRIVKYDSETGTTKTMCERGEDVPFDLMFKWITAVNEGEDGTMEIEYVDLIGEEM